MTIDGYMGVWLKRQYFIHFITDTCHTDGDIHYATTGAFTHSMGDSQRAAVKVYRDVDAGIGGGCSNDEYAQDAKLLAVQFCYESNNVFSGEGT